MVPVCNVIRTCESKFAFKFEVALENILIVLAFERVVAGTLGARMAENKIAHKKTAKNVLERPKPSEARINPNKAINISNRRLLKISLKKLQTG